MSNLVIVGGGAGGTVLIPILREYKEIKIVGVADISREAPALKMARKLGIKTSTSYKRFRENFILFARVIRFSTSAPHRAAGVSLSRKS